MSVPLFEITRGIESRVERLMTEIAAVVGAKQPPLSRFDFLVAEARGLLRALEEAAEYEGVDDFVRPLSVSPDPERLYFPCPVCEILRRGPQAGDDCAACFGLRFVDAGVGLRDLPELRKAGAA